MTKRTAQTTKTSRKAFYVQMMGGSNLPGWGCRILAQTQGQAVQIFKERFGDVEIARACPYGKRPVGC